MRTQTIVFLLSLSLLTATNANQTTDQDQEALRNTQALLRDKSRREKEVLATDSKAKQADQQADTITGGNAADKQEMYDISADLMPWIVEESHGDPEKMNALMERALRNPQKFVESMPAAQREKIKALSKKIEKSKPRP
jgi:hypothetical protein